MVQYIEELELRFNVIAVTETWLRESNYDLFNIDGYYQESNFRTLLSFKAFVAPMYQTIFLYFQ